MQEFRSCRIGNLFIEPLKPVILISLHHSTTPLLHHSITPPLHHSTTPLLHHSITPSLLNSALILPIFLDGCAIELELVNTL